MTQNGIGISNLPNVRHRTFCRAGIDFNIMAAGSTGLGKSSFVNQMLGACVLSADPFLEAGDGVENYEVFGASGSGAASSLEDRYFYRNALLNIQISKFFASEQGFQTRITVTEVDGVGDSVCNNRCWEPVGELINDNFRDFLEQERRSVRSLIKDRRIHVCLYFLEPNPGHVKAADLRTMKEISRHCNLVPVVGKSDLLNEVQKQECHDTVLSALGREGIEVFPMEAGSAANGPFFVVCRSMDGRQQTEREYPWGLMFLDQVKSNDFYMLADALVRKNLIRLVEATEGFYDGFKTKEIGRSVEKPEALEQDDRRLTKEIQKKIREDEGTIAEIRQKLLEKKRHYESRLFEMNNRN